VLARHPVKERWDALWIVAGRVADWSELPGAAELARRTKAALERRPPPHRRPAIPVDEVDEIRIVQSWVAANEPPQLELGPGVHPADAADWAASVAASKAPIAV
jgi:DNA polymerase-3 subunit epsilon